MSRVSVFSIIVLAFLTLAAPLAAQEQTDYMRQKPAIVAAALRAVADSLPSFYKQMRTPDRFVFDPHFLAAVADERGPTALSEGDIREISKTGVVRAEVEEASETLRCDGAEINSFCSLRPGTVRVFPGPLDWISEREVRVALGLEMAFPGARRLAASLHTIALRRSETGWVVVSYEMKEH